MIERPIHIGLSPNLTFENFKSSLLLVFQPWKWQQGGSINRVEQWFKNYFGVEVAVSLNAGRSALLAILTSLEIPKDSEVLVQAFTCVAVPNSIRWASLSPVFVDIDRTLNVNVADAEKKVTSKTKVLIVQHTFGIPADMSKITAFCKKYHLILIEDCAHALGATYQTRLIGSFGDASFFSFGRDKIVSSIFGGLAIINQKPAVSQGEDSKINREKLLNYQHNLPYPSSIWIFQQLLHPIITYPALYLYHFFGIGKILLFLSQKLRFLSFPVYENEKKGYRPAQFPRLYPNVLAELLLLQLKKLQLVNEKRREIAEAYFQRLKGKGLTLPHQGKGAVYLRFNVLTSRADELRFIAKSRGIILGNWYHRVIDPEGVDLSKIGYIKGSCPQAEKVSRESLNLPTYPALTARQIQEVVELFNHPNFSPLRPGKGVSDYEYGR